MKFAMTVASAIPRLLFAAALFYAAPAFAQTTSDTFPNRSITIYVADFDLAATTNLSRSPASRIATSPTAPANAPTPSGATTSATAAAHPPTAADASAATQTPSSDGRPDTPKPEATPTEGGSPDGTKPDTAKPDTTNAAPSDATDPAADNPPVPIAPATPGTGTTATSPNAPPATTNAPVASATASHSQAAASAASRTPAKKPDALDPRSDDPRVRAAKLIDLTAATFVKSLEHAGYTVKRLRNSAAPESGVVIRGVFAQVDPNAGIRRAVYGGTDTDPTMLLFVGVGNLAKPQQTLYQVVSGAPSGNLGPLISISAYAPVSRYELAHDPSEDSLKQTADQFASDLTRLLNANPLAFGQP